MHAALIPFPEALADACGKLQAATDHDRLRNQYEYQQGLLRGYYCAGVIADVQLRAALDQLRAVHHERFMAVRA